MKPLPVILIFDVGKTNKKILLFDERYNIVFEESVRFDEISDEDGIGEVYRKDFFDKYLGNSLKPGDPDLGI